MIWQSFFDPRFESLVVEIRGSTGLRLVSTLIMGTLLALNVGWRAGAVFVAAGAVSTLWIFLVMAPPAAGVARGPASGFACLGAIVAASLYWTAGGAAFWMTGDPGLRIMAMVILVSLLIAGCTLATGIAAGLADRKRPFSLLRLTGARLGTLRRVVALEGAVPLLSVAAVAIGTGFAGAAMFASEAQNHPMVAPGVGYYLLTGAGVMVSLGIIAATFPLLERITGPEVARNE